MQNAKTMMLNVHQNEEGEEHRENANLVETNIEIKVEMEFLAGINAVKEIEDDKGRVLQCMW